MRQARLWATPQTDSFRSRGGDRRDEAGLDRQARLWATPTLHGNANRAGISPKAGDGLRTQAVDRFSRPDQPTPTHGAPSSAERRSLNPLFVEWLMGWPPGWTSFACSATALSRWSRRMRCAFWQLGLPDDMPAQPSLFA